MSAIAVIYAVRPHPGQKDQVRGLFERHVPTLRSLGLITDRPALLLWSTTDGVFIESFEWTSVEHSRRAEAEPAVQEIWGAFARHGEFVPLASLSEAARTFAHFEPVA